MEQEKEQIESYSIASSVTSLAIDANGSTVRLTGSSVTKHKSGDDYNPFEHRETKRQYSNFGAFAHLVKAGLGAGIMAMPMAFKQGGLIFGVFGCIVAGFLCSHCVLMLVWSAQTLCVRLKKPSLTFADVAEAAFNFGPRWLHPYALVGRNFVKISLFLTYFLSLTAYTIFIGAAIQQVVEYYYGEVMDTRAYLAALTVVLVPLGLVRELKHLVPCSVISNICIVTGFGFTLYYIFTDIPDISSRHYGTTLKGLPIFFSTVLFAMEGIGTVLAVENTMRNPRKMGGWFGVMSMAMTVIVVLFAALGFLGYLKFGELTEASVILNLPQNQVLAQMVKLLMAVAIILTYPVQFYVPCEITWDWVSEDLRARYPNSGQNVMRVVLVLLTLVMAIAVPNLELVVSLVGSLLFSTLGIFIPAFIETVVVWQTKEGLYKLYVVVKNSLLSLLFVLTAFSGAYSALS